MDKVNTNNIIRGTYGRVWMNGELLAEAKSFEGKATMNFEEVNLAGDLGTHQRYMGYAGEGTMVLHKVDSKIAKTIAECIRTGIYLISNLWENWKTRQHWAQSVWNFWK